MGAPKQPPYAPDVNASDVPWHTFVNGATLPGSRGGVTEFGGAVASAGASDVDLRGKHGRERVSGCAKIERIQDRRYHGEQRYMFGSHRT